MVSYVQGTERGHGKGRVHCFFVVPLAGIIFCLAAVIIRTGGL